MAEPLTWKNVSAPDFSGSANMLKTASELLSKGTEGLSDGLGGWTKARRERADMQLTQAAMGYDDPALLDQDLRSGKLTQGIDPTLLNADLINKAQNRVGALQTTVDARKAARLDESNKAVGILGAQLAEYRRIGDDKGAASVLAELQNYVGDIGAPLITAINNDAATQETKVNTKAWDKMGTEFAKTQIAAYDPKVLEQVYRQAESIPEYQRKGYFAAISKRLGYDVDPDTIDQVAMGSAQSDIEKFQAEQIAAELAAASSGGKIPVTPVTPVISPEKIAELTAARDAAVAAKKNTAQKILGGISTPFTAAYSVLDNLGNKSSAAVWGGKEKKTDPTPYFTESNRLDEDAIKAEKALNAALKQNANAAKQPTVSTQTVSGKTRADGANSIVGGINFSVDGRPFTDLSVKEFVENAEKINAASKLDPMLNRLSGGKGSSASGGFQFQPGVLKNIVQQNPELFPDGLNTKLSASNQEKAAKALYDQLQSRGVSMIEQGWQGLGKTPELRAKYGGNSKNRPPWSEARKDILDNEAIGGSKAFDRDLALETSPQNAFRPVALTPGQVDANTNTASRIIAESNVASKANSANADAQSAKRYYEAAIAPGSDDLTTAVNSMGKGYENASLKVQDIAEENGIPFGVAAVILKESQAKAGWIKFDTFGPDGKFIIDEDRLARKIEQYKGFKPDGSITRATVKELEGKNSEKITALEAKRKTASDTLKALTYRQKTGAASPASVAFAQNNLRMIDEELGAALQQRN